MAVAQMSLLNLENKTRQQPKIAHEQGAGSQCTKCGSKCPGLDLHFWRKICRNCRCGKELHNVTDEDPSIRLIRLLAVNPFQMKMDLELRGANNDPVAASSHHHRPSKLNFNSQTGSAVDAPSSPLDWVPPTSDSQLAVKYMEQLPLAKQPITGSQAAVDRKIALDRQLPLHDLDPEQCSNLSANEKRKMEEYVKNVQQYVVGQGLIQECPPRVGKLPPPPPQLDRILGEKVNHLSLQESDAAGKRPVPLSFVTAKPFVKADAPSTEQIKRMSTKPHAGKIFDDDDDLPPPPPDMLMMDHQTPAAPPLHTPPPPPPELVVEEVPPEPSGYKRPQDPVREFFDFLDEQEGKKLPGKLKSPFLHQSMAAAASGSYNATARPFGSSPGTSPNLNQRNLKVIAPPSGGAAATGSRGSSPRLGERGSTTIGQQPNNNNNSSGGTRRLLTTDFDYFPPEEPKSQKNNNNNHSNQVVSAPVANNNNNNSSPLSHRRPSAQPQPCGHENNKYVTGQIPVLSPQQQQQEVLLQDPEGQSGSWCCRKCSQPIEAGTVAIFAERAGSDKCWHPQCFVCSICHEMLADLIYFFVDDDVFCGRHYAEKMKIPRCKACDELIFAPEYTSAEDATWHMDHFCCWICDTPLAGHQYTPIDGQPHCLDCYQKKYGKDCYECCQPIRAEETRVSHGEMNWHNRASCFKCRQCQVSMMNRQFILKGGQIYCSRECVVQYAQCQAQPVLV